MRIPLGGWASIEGFSCGRQLTGARRDLRARLALREAEKGHLAGSVGGVVTDSAGLACCFRLPSQWCPCSASLGLHACVVKKDKGKYKGKHKGNTKENTRENTRENTVLAIFKFWLKAGIVRGRWRRVLPSRFLDGLDGATGNAVGGSSDAERVGCFRC